MTDKELLQLFEKPQEERAYLDFLFGDGKKKIMERVIQTKQFKNFFYKMIEKGYDDEHYAYFHDNDIEEAFGTRLSWLSYIAEEPINVNKDGDYFPIHAEAFYFENKKYWLMTMVGQGTLSWVIDDNEFKQAYGWTEVK